LGGVGTFLAAIKRDVWIAVTNTIAASSLSFLEFRQFDSTLIGYNQTATNLHNILLWWNALTPEARNDPKNVEKLVESSERVIRSETTGWVQEMRDAMANLYKTDEKELSLQSEARGEPEKESEQSQSANSTPEGLSAKEEDIQVRES
jgi:Sec-independent protein translocase protein TatA